MAGDTQITVVGNLTGDPELRFIQSGAAVVNFTVASTPRTFERQTNEWKDGDTLFMRCSLWREAAENVAESLTKGMRVIVTGRLVSRSWEANGEKRTVMELQVGAHLERPDLQVVGGRKAFREIRDGRAVGSKLGERIAKRSAENHLREGILPGRRVKREVGGVVGYRLGELLKLNPRVRPV